MTITSHLHQLRWHHRWMHHAGRRLALIAVVVAALVLAACSEGSGGDSAADRPADEPAMEPAAGFSDDGAQDAAADEDSSEPADEPAMEPAEEGGADQPSGDDGSDGSDGAGLAVPTALTPADIGRDVIYRAGIEVEVDDVGAAGREAQQVIAGLGGIMFGQHTETEPTPRSTFVFKVLPADFGTALDRLAAIGDLVDQTVSADDVTERVVDLQSRINTSEASVARLRELLDQAGNVDVIAQLENQLLDRETTLEQLRGQLRTLQDQVDLATIELTITPSPLVVPDSGMDVAVWLAAEGDDPCRGRSDLVATPDQTVGLCVEIENVGDSTLTDVDLRSLPSALRLEDFTAVEGDLDAVAPGGRLLLVHSAPTSELRFVERDAGIWPVEIRVTTTPVDDRDNVLDPLSATVGATLTVDAEDTLPGFGDALEGGVGALALIGSLLLVAAGVVLPFVPVAALVFAGFHLVRRRRSVEVEDASAAVAAP